jgi:outer membrane protein OmpA-like peptidoglycan-associated protein
MLTSFKKNTMTLRPQLTILSVVLSMPFGLLAQKELPIVLTNPSFEDIPRSSSTPSGWFDCGQMRDSPPDVQPGFWEVSTPPKHGSSYLGLVVRDNETWEAVGQRLIRPMEVNQCYELSMDLSKAPKYLSKSPLSADVVDFATPVIVRIYGGNGYCDRGELLAKSTIINHSRWVGYNFRLSPTKGSYSFIVIEAYFKTPVLFPYNGHVLIDNLSAIKPVVCGADKMPEKKETQAVTAATPTKKNTTTPSKSNNSSSSSTASVTEAPAVTIGKNAKKNVVYRLEKVYFEANKYELKAESETQLAELLAFLRKRTDIVIEVGGHTNNQMWPNDAFALELSTNRAKSVANWLISNGIPANRVQFKGYGWTKPILPNTTAEGRRKNQRVEATIINSNG